MTAAYDIERVAVLAEQLQGAICAAQAHHLPDELVSRMASAYAELMLLVAEVKATKLENEP